MRGKKERRKKNATYVKGANRKNLEDKNRKENKEIESPMKKGCSVLRWVAT